MHRREWLRDPANVVGVIAALEAQAAEYPAVKFIWPVHPAVRAFTEKRVQLGSPLLTVNPLPYEKAALLLTNALGVITDSGGLQEEAATLGVPAAIMRFACDRPESLDAGVARLFEPTGDGVVTAVSCLLGGQLPRRPSDIFGGVESAANIARLLAQLA
jgi:UDP-N-acetylglucosamine 2-epimerase